MSKQVIFASICVLFCATAACARTTRLDPTPNALPAPLATTVRTASPEVTAVAETEEPDAESRASAGPPLPVSWAPRSASAIDGPHEIAFEPGRPVWFALAKDVTGPRRLIGHLHGICGPPVYACGKWIGAGVDAGVMVCPQGNARCGDSPVSPASWEAPTWNELVTIMDHDLEASIAKVDAKRKGSIDRTGAVLTGYSRGAYAASVIARLPKNKDKWPYLVLIEANVSLSAASLRAAGVKAVALVAGEQGTEIAGERTTAAALEKDGFPVRLFVMKKTGHLYSDDMEYVMHDALSWVTSQ